MMILAVMMVMTISANAMSYNAAKHLASGGIVAMLTSTLS